MKIVHFKLDETEKPEMGSVWYRPCLQGGADQTAICIERYGKYITLFADGSGNAGNFPSAGRWKNVPKGKTITLTLES